MKMNRTKDQEKEDEATLLCNLTIFYERNFCITKIEKVFFFFFFHFFLRFAGLLPTGRTSLLSYTLSFDFDVDSFFLLSFNVEKKKKIK